MLFCISKIFKYDGDRLLIADISRDFRSWPGLSNLCIGCGTIPKISFEIDEGMLRDLKGKALEKESDCSDLIVEYVKRGLKERDNMVNIALNDNVMEKVKIMSKLTDRTPEEVVNDTLWDNLRKIVDVPDEIDYDKIWSMLDHDKPEGDDILDNLARLGDENWD